MPLLGVARGSRVCEASVDYCDKIVRGVDSSRVGGESWWSKLCGDVIWNGMLRLKRGTSNPQGRGFIPHLREFGFWENRVGV